MSRRQASPANVFARLWSKAFAAGRRKASSRNRPRVRLQLEHLEDRLVPAVIDVTTLADSTGAGTLRSAIAQADTNDANGDTTNIIDLTVAGNYNVGQSGLGGLAIFANATATQSGLSLTIQNTSGGNVAISGDNTNRIFDINPNDIIQTNPNVALGAVAINGVTIENGLASDAANADGPNASGGGIRDQGPVDLTLNNDILTNNSATADGGGVSMENLTSTHWALMLNNTTVSDNHAGDAGGGVEEDGTGLVSITNSTIADNTTLNQGAGIWLDAIGTGTATLNVTNSIISGNTAGMVGGGIGQAGSSTVTITSSTIANNFTVGFGGGFGDQNNLGTLVVANSLFLNNSAGTNGGGIQEGGPSTTITNSEIKGNAAGINGSMAIGTTGGGAANTVMGSGGGLFVDGGALTLTASTLADNTASQNGGGIELDTTAASTITNSTITDNTALNSGGIGNGGGIDDAATGMVALVNNTITNNFAVNGGGIFFAGTTGLTLQNNILALNTVTGTGPDFDFTGAITGVDLGGNLIGIGDPAIFTAGTTQQGTAGSPLNPMVAGLANNGGPLVGAPSDQITLETEALLSGSPAVGKGMANGLTSDERGFPRTPPIDIGAFQLNATPQLTIGTATTTGVITPEADPAVIDVTTLSDGTGPGTLRSAIAQANTNDANGITTNTIDITVAGAYNVGQLGLGALSIFSNATVTVTGLSLTIQNTSGGNVIIDGDNATRVFDINPNIVTPLNNVPLGAVTINGVTIENGLASDAANADGPNASGGGIRDQGPVDLTLNNDILTNNSATADGGGVSMENLASTKWMLNLNNTTVTNNHAGDAGGGVEEDGTGIVNINNSTLADNTTLNQGAGVWLDAINNGTATLNVTNSIVSGNTAGMVGGGIGQAGTSTVTITGSTIANNFTVGFGGGFGDQNNLGTLVVANSLFLNNSAGTNGGGIQEGGPSTTITNSEIKGNAAGINGSMAIGTTGGGAANTVMGSGGGLFVDGGALTLTASTLADNTASQNGGGIELDTIQPSTITNTTIVGNTALNSGGIGNGGGIDDAATGMVALVNNTITNNFAVNGGGLFFPGTTDLTLQNNIIALNTVTGTGPDIDFTGAITGVDLGGNLIGIGDPAIFTAGTTQQGTVGSPLNPMVTGLTNNGGPLAGAPGAEITVETEALLPGSPAIGKGVANGLATDERGALRINNNDVGAFQFADATLQLNIGTQATLVINTTETVSVTVTNNSGNPLPADNSILTVTASGGLNIGGTQTFTLGPIAAGQSQTFSFNVTGTGLGTQTITARVTSVDTNPATTTTSTTVNVTQTTTQPIGALTLFAFGFGPTGIDLFEISSTGAIFAVAFPAGGAPIFINTMIQLPLAALGNGRLLALLTAANGQNFIIDVFNPFVPGVFSAVLAALHI